MLLNMVGGGAAGSLPEFTYTGQYQLIDDGRANGKQNWRIKLLTSGTLTFLKPVGLLQAFLVGAGGGNNSGNVWAQPGGGGGYTLTSDAQAVPNTEYQIVIGAGVYGGTGGSTTAFGLTAKGGNNGSGGSGGGARNGEGTGGSGGSDGSDASGGRGQRTTTREFGEPTGDLYAGGGGGDGKYPGKGGEGGGGNAAAWGTGSGQKGQANTGGGAGAADNYGSTGGSGIVVIRNKR